jgi:MFS family permease
MSTQLSSSSPATADERRGSSPGAALAVALLGFFFITLDALLVSVALPAISGDVGGGITGLQWVVAGYTLMFAPLLLFAGSLSDRDRRTTGVRGRPGNVRRRVGSVRARPTRAVRLDWTDGGALGHDRARLRTHRGRRRGVRRPLGAGGALAVAVAALVFDGLRTSLLFAGLLPAATTLASLTLRHA